MTVRVTKVFTFDMAHALYGYDGPCKNIHGHTYRLHVTVAGKINDQPGHPEQGLVVDFGKIKDITVRHIISQFDHALVLHKRKPADALSSSAAWCFAKGSQVGEIKTGRNSDKLCGVESRRLITGY
jgi:6-pyruvoyltetrahydropterin/6-carboxytetrahydropterin synthase